MARIKSEIQKQAIVTKGADWTVAAYIRLSRDDGNDESLSVTNQRKIINEFLDSFDGAYQLVDFYIDDGKSGTDYERPDFQRMIHDMESGKVNCIVSKDLSRMFRNYSDQGYFLEKIFPMYKTRFITINSPKIDSYLDPDTIDGLEVPINGLMNDRYAAKTSRDIRTTFAAKRRKGEFIGAFAPFGYQKDPANKNRLMIDEEAAQVIRDIFHWFVYEGVSKRGICIRLNHAGIPNPTAYKQRNGLHYCNPFSDVNDPYWVQKTLRGILTNPVYIGTMVQGRQRVISYKVHKAITPPEDEWFVVEGTHEAIIDRETFEKAQLLQKHDSRTAPEKQALYLFSGFLKCADCKKSMRRKMSKQKVYYYCRTFNDKAVCFKHSVREDLLVNVVLSAIQTQINLISSLSGIIDTIHQAPAIMDQSKRLAATLQLRERELDKVTALNDGLYSDWKGGEISNDQYHRLKKNYETKSGQLKQIICNLKEESVVAERGISEDDPYLTAFLKHRNITALNRSTLVDLVKQIYIHDHGEVEIEFKFADQHRRILEFIEAANE